jgi:hypothetical protein
MKLRMARTLLLVISLLLIGNISSASAQAGLTYFVTDVDASAFPSVSFEMRATDLGNDVVSGLSAEDLTAFENGEEVGDLELTPHEDGAITYIIVLDLGRLSNYRSFGENRIRQVLTTLSTGGYFIDNLDTVLVLGRRNETSDQTVTMMPATQSSADLTTAAANFNLGATPSATMGLVGVEDAIRQASDLVPVSGSQTTAIIFITRFIEDPSSTVAPTSAQNVAVLARQNHLSIHVLHTDFSRARADTLQVLAEGSGGTYTAINRSSYQSAVTTLYQAIDAQRTYYTISYRSPNADSGDREITVNNPSDQGEGQAGSYSVSVSAPSVSMVEPTPNSTIRREARIEEGGEVPSFDVTNLRVTAEAEFPDGFPRNIRSAQLLVNGIVEDSLEVGPGQTEFMFDWDLSDIADEGTNLVTLEISVEDELGLMGEAQSSVNVEVIFPESGSGFELTPTVAAIGLPVLCLILVVALAAVGAVVFLVRSGSKSRDEEGKKATPVVQPTMFAADVEELVLATLTVLEGPTGMIGETLNITMRSTKLGRDPKRTDISFYSDTQSSVSRLHATVELDEDNAFRLTDNGSSAGTRLNGRPIPRDAGVLLDDGDEIVLADLSQRGVKLRFNFATSEDLQAPAGTADDRTHLMTDYNLQLPDENE